DDFSTEQPSTFVQAPPKLKFDEAAWTERVRELSGRFKNYPSVLTSHVSVQAQTETKYLVNTEGSRPAHGRGFARVASNASAIAWKAIGRRMRAKARRSPRVWAQGFCRIFYPWSSTLRTRRSAASTSTAGTITTMRASRPGP